MRKPTLAELKTLHEIGLEELLENDEFITLNVSSDYSEAELLNQIKHDKRISEVRAIEYLEELKLNFKTLVLYFDSLEVDKLKESIKQRSNDIDIIERGLLDKGYNQALESTFVEPQKALDNLLLEVD